MFACLLLLLAPLLSVDDSNRVIATQPPWHRAGPTFSTHEPLFSPDGRTRLTIYATNVAGNEPQTFIRLVDHFGREFWLQPSITPLADTPYHQLTFSLDFGYDDGVIILQVAFINGGSVEFSNSGSLQIANSTQTALVACDGNSLTQGTGTGSPGVESYPAQLQSQLSTLGLAYTVINFGVAGQTTTQMSSDAAIQLDPLFTATRPRNILVAWELGNSMVVGGATPEQAVSDFVAYAQQRKQAGFQVYALNILKRTDLPELQRTDLNQRLAAAAPNTFTLIDIASNSQLNDLTNSTTRHPDGVHLVVGGYTLVATAVRQSILQ